MKSTIRQKIIEAAEVMVASKSTAMELLSLLEEAYLEELSPMDREAIENLREHGELPDEYE